MSVLFHLCLKAAFESLIWGLVGFRNDQGQKVYHPLQFFGREKITTAIHQSIFVVEGQGGLAEIGASAGRSGGFGWAGLVAS